ALQPREPPSQSKKPGLTAKKANPKQSAYDWRIQTKSPSHHPPCRSGPIKANQGKSSLPLSFPGRSGLNHGDSF
ncbi:MAG: hypothetical protein ABSF38_10165, partial [Verrucomicrobiota bacterium]